MKDELNPSQSTTDFNVPNMCRGQYKMCPKVDRICGVWLSLCVCMRLASRVSRLSASASVSRLRASVSRASRVCLRLFTSRVPNACVCVCVCLASVSRLSSCLASVCVHLSRVCLASVVLSRVCASASVSRLSSCLASVVLSRVGRLVSRLSVYPCECLRELAHFMRRSSFKEFKRFLLSSYYRCTYRLCRLYEQTFNILI